MKLPRYLPLLLFFIVACGLITPEQATPTATSGSAAATPPPTPVPSTLSPSPSPTLPLPPTNTAIPDDLSVNAAQFFLYPTATIYAGDQVTFQVFPYVPEELDSMNVELQIWVDEQMVVDGRLTGLPLGCMNGCGIRRG